MGDWLGKSGQTIATVGVAIGVSAIVVASGGTLAPLAIAVIAGAASGAASSAASSALGTAFNGGSGRDFLHAIVTGTISGAVSGFIGGAVGKWSIKALENLGINGINSPLIKSALVGGISSSLSGGAVGFGIELLMGGKLNDAFHVGGKEAILV